MHWKDGKANREQYQAWILEGWDSAIISPALLLSQLSSSQHGSRPPTLCEWYPQCHTRPIPLSPGKSNYFILSEWKFVFSSIDSLSQTLIFQVKTTLPVQIWREPPSQSKRIKIIHYKISLLFPSANMPLNPHSSYPPYSYLAKEGGAMTVLILASVVLWYLPSIPLPLV